MNENQQIKVVKNNIDIVNKMLVVVDRLLKTSNLKRKAGLQGTAVPAPVNHYKKTKINKNVKLSSKKQSNKSVAQTKKSKDSLDEFTELILAAGTPVPNNPVNNNSGGWKGHSPSTSIKISIGANSMNTDYNGFFSMNKGRVLLGGVIYQLSDNLQSLYPLQYCPEHQDKNGNSSTCMFMVIDSIVCSKVGGEINQNNRVYINNKQFIEQICTESYNNGKVPIGTKILVLRPFQPQ